MFILYYYLLIRLNKTYLLKKKGRRERDKQKKRNNTNLFWELKFASIGSIYLFDKSICINIDFYQAYLSLLLSLFEK